MSSLASLEEAPSHPVRFALAGASGAERLEAQLVSPGYFGALRMTPRMGRFFDPAEHDAVGGPSHVVIGHDLWRRHWHGPSDALGATVEINGEPFTVIGVAPPGFRGAELPGRAHLWVTSSALGTLVSSESREELRSRRHRTWDQLVGRLREGADPQLVEAEANATMASVRRWLQGSAHSFLALHFVFRIYEGIGLAGLGTLLAAPLIWVSTRIIESRLVGVEPLDPVTYGVGFCALLGVAWLASRIPAGRATRVSPGELLRGS